MSTAPIETAGKMAAAIARLPLRVHRDQRGTISIISVFAVLLLTMLLGMILNVGRQIDGKVRMQNAADAAAYSGGLVMTRGMNDLAFSNHLLADVFALTAFMREARDRNAQSYTDEILAAWTKVGGVFSRSGFPKFDALGPAIIQKVPLEQELVNSWSDWGAASSELILPLLEEILREEMIPEYERAVVEAFPDIAQVATAEVVRRNQGRSSGQGEMLGVLWRASGEPVGGDSELTDPSLPVVDPVGGCTCACCGGTSGDGSTSGSGDYARTARRQRDQLAFGYLRRWNNSAMVLFDRKAKMCQFGRLWRSFTRGQLRQLLEVEYPSSNLPHVIRTEKRDVTDGTAHLEQDFTFLAVAYRRKLPGMMPRLFGNPMENDMLTYAAVRIFVPRRRLVWKHYSPGQSSGSMPLGGVPGDFLDYTESQQPSTPQTETEDRWFVGRQGVPTHWDLLNQHWTCQLVPAEMTNLSLILQMPPPVWFSDGGEVTPPNLGGLSSEDLGRVSPH